MSEEKDPVVKKLYEWLEEAVTLRFGPDANDNKLAVPSFEEGPHAFIDQLLAARQRADRIEELLSSSKRVRARLAAVQRDAEDEYKDKRDQALADGAQTKAEYSLGDERRAEANLKSFAEKRAERAAARRLAIADEVVTAISDIHWGLNGWRADMRDVVRSYQLESNLER